MEAEGFTDTYLLTVIAFESQLKVCKQNKLYCYTNCLKQKRLKMNIVFCRVAEKKGINIYSHFFFIMLSYRKKNEFFVHFVGSNVMKIAPEMPIVFI